MLLFVQEYFLVKPIVTIENKTDDIFLLKKQFICYRIVNFKEIKLDRISSHIPVVNSSSVWETSGNKLKDFLFIITKNGSTAFHKAWDRARQVKANPLSRNQTIAALGLVGLMAFYVFHRIYQDPSSAAPKQEPTVQQTPIQPDSSPAPEIPSVTPTPPPPTAAHQACNCHASQILRSCREAIEKTLMADMQEDTIYFIPDFANLSFYNFLDDDAKKRIRLAYSKPAILKSIERSMAAPNESSYYNRELYQTGANEGVRIDDNPNLQNGLAELIKNNIVHHSKHNFPPAKYPELVLLREEQQRDIKAERAKAALAYCKQFFFYSPQEYLPTSEWQLFVEKNPDSRALFIDVVHNFYKGQYKNFIYGNSPQKDNLLPSDHSSAGNSLFSILTNEEQRALQETLFTYLKTCENKITRPRIEQALGEMISEYDRFTKKDEKPESKND